MKNRSPIIIALGCILAFSIVLALAACGGSSSKTTTPIPATTPPTDTRVFVKVDPQDVSAKIGDTAQFKITVTPNANGISGGEVNLRFDPSAINIVSVDPGDLFGANPLVGTKQIDNQKGTLKYALARIGQTQKNTPTSTFAMVTVKVLSSAKTGSYNLSLFSIGMANETFNSISTIVTNDGVLKVQK